MPFYRIDGTMVHFKGTKLPPPCEHIITLGENTMECKVISLYLCDSPRGGGRTCDAAMCEEHAEKIAKNLHLCAECLYQHPDAVAQRGLFSRLVEPAVEGGR